MRSRFASRTQSWRWRWQVWYAGTGSGALATAPLSLKPTEFRWASLSSHRPRKPLAAAFLMRAVLPSLDSLIESPPPRSVQSFVLMSLSCVADEELPTSRVECYEDPTG